MIHKIQKYLLLHIDVIININYQLFLQLCYYHIFDLMCFLYSILAMAVRCTSSGPSASRSTLAHDQKPAIGVSADTPAPPYAWKIH